MKAKDLRAKDEAALKTELNDLLQTRRDIARVRTVLSQKASAK